MSDGRATILRRLSHAALALLVTLIFAGLVSSVLALPPVAPGLADDVNAAIKTSGIDSQVTATLLDFRSYDTLLEIAVLLLVVTAIRALRRGEPPAIPTDDEVLAFLGNLLLPVMILVAGYLLMSGLDAAGGAFQAGALLAAAGVLLILAGRTMPVREDGPAMRIGLAVGLAAFVVVGTAGLLIADAFLGYPRQGAGAIALLLETGVTISVALALIDLFVGVLRSAGASRSKETRDR